MYSCLLFVAVVTTLGMGSDTPGQTEGAPATILVTLPADAKLTIDGSPTKSTTAKRWFVSPPLGEGNHVYVLKASFVREGKFIIVEQKVNVQAGKETVVSLDLPGQVFVDSSSTSRAFYPGETLSNGTFYLLPPTNYRAMPRFNHPGQAR